MCCHVFYYILQYSYYISALCIKTLTITYLMYLDSKVYFHYIYTYTISCLSEMTTKDCKKISTRTNFLNGSFVVFLTCLTLILHRSFARKDYGAQSAKQG